MFNGLKSEYHVAEQHACYTGAINAGALHKLLSFAMKDHLEVVYGNKAYTITAVFNVRGGILSMYAHRLAKPLVPPGSIEYRITQIGIFFCHVSLARTRFDKVSPPYQNARDWARKEERGVIAAAITRARRNVMATTQIRGDHDNSCPRLVALFKLSFVLKEKVCPKKKMSRKVMFPA